MPEHLDRRQRRDDVPQCPRMEERDFHYLITKLVRLFWLAVLICAATLAAIPANASPSLTPLTRKTAARAPQVLDEVERDDIPVKVGILNKPQ